MGINVYLDSDRVIVPAAGASGVLLKGIVTAVASLPTNCPTAPGNGADAPTPSPEDTACVYAFTNIEKQTSGLWGPLVSCIGCGPAPVLNRLELQVACPASSAYRTFFQQAVAGGPNAAWTDARFTGGTSVDCSIQGVTLPLP